jgi:hypothetical protein
MMQGFLFWNGIMKRGVFYGEPTILSASVNRSAAYP